MSGESEGEPCPDGKRTGVRRGLMAGSDELLRHAVDEVLDPVWPRERRRAVRRLGRATLTRIIGGFLGLWSLGFASHLVVGGPTPGCSSA